MKLTDPLVIIKGKTLDVALLWAESVPAYKAITAVDLDGAVTLTVNNHGLPDDWPVWVERVRQPVHLNSAVETGWVVGCGDDGSHEPYYVEVVDADTLLLRGVSGEGWPAWSGDGVVRTFPPGDLSGLQGRAQFRRTVDAEVIELDLLPESEAGSNGRVALDVASATINLIAPASATEQLSLHRGVFDVELYDGNGLVVSALDVSPYVVTPEVTR